MNQCGPHRQTGPAVSGLAPWESSCQKARGLWEGALAHGPSQAIPIPQLPHNCSSRSPRDLLIVRSQISFPSFLDPLQKLLSNVFHQPSTLGFSEVDHLCFSRHCLNPSFSTFSPPPHFPPPTYMHFLELLGQSTMSQVAVSVLGGYKFKVKGLAWPCPI